MKEIKAKAGMYLTQAESNPQSRIYVTTIVGASPDEAQWRDASQEEKEAYTDVESFDNYNEMIAVKDELAEQTSKLTRKINYIGLTNNEALSVKYLYPTWESKINSTIEIGFVTLYDDKLWRARQTHTALDIYPPSLDTASLYEVIVEEHTGEKDDPIPYTPPMEIFNGKYYIQDDVLYICTRDSETPLSHNLADLVGIYVELIN